MNCGNWPRGQLSVTVASALEVISSDIPRVIEVIRYS
jgi:hypothetical protein